MPETVQKPFLRQSCGLNSVFSLRVFGSEVVRFRYQTELKASKNLKLKTKCRPQVCERKSQEKYGRLLPERTVCVLHHSHNLVPVYPIPRTRQEPQHLTIVQTLTWLKTYGCGHLPWLKVWWDGTPYKSTWDGCFNLRLYHHYFLVPDHHNLQDKPVKFNFLHVLYLLHCYCQSIHDIWHEITMTGKCLETWERKINPYTVYKERVVSFVTTTCVWNWNSIICVSRFSNT